MTTFDSVQPDAPIIAAVPAKTFRYLQTWAPFALHALAVFSYLLALATTRNSGHPESAPSAFILVAIICVLLASFLRRLSPYLVPEVGSCRYDRVSSVATRLLPNTRQSWIVVMTLAALTVGLPLYMYLFTHYTDHGFVYGFAMFGLSGRLGSPFGAFCVGLLLCGVAMGVCFALVLLPLGGRNPLFVAEAESRVRAWIRLASWFPLTLLFLVLFVFSRLLLCGGPVGRYHHVRSDVGCNTNRSLFAGLFGWFTLSVTYMCLDVGMAYVRFLSGSPVVYYALEPRLDGFFSELLVWTLKVTAAMVTFVDPIGAYVIAAVLFLGLFVFACLRRTSTVEALEEMIRWSVLIVAITCVVSGCLTSRRIPAAVPGLVLLLCWAAAVAGAVALYFRRFGWEVFGSGREVTADIIVI